MRKAVQNVVEAIGHTPMIRLGNSVSSGSHEFYGKLEYANPGGSVKDRIAVAIVEDAEKTGKIKPGGTLIEATSGNTGVGLAMVAAVKGYKCIFTMPEKMSEEKRATLRAYGARVVITPNGVEPDDPRSHYSVAKKFAELIPNSFCTNQYHNPANAKQHMLTTGPEIWEQMEGKIDVFVAGIGTGGTLSGVGRYLKKQNPKIKIVCADPIGSILFDLFYHKKVVTPPGPYLVEGIGEDMLPDNVHFDVMDDFVQVTDRESFFYCREMCRKDGLMVGPSSGTALAAAVKYAHKLTHPSRIVALLPDTGKSYLSKVFNDTWMRENKLLDSPLTEGTVKELLQKANPEPDLLRLEPKMKVQETVAKMLTAGVSTALVYEGSRVVGMIDSTDILAALANSRISGNELIMHLVRANLPEIEESARLIDLQKKFESAEYVKVKGSQRYLRRTQLVEFLGGV